MYSPHKFGHRVGNIGQPLPNPFKQLDENRANFRRGATSLIAGTPGSFKSVIALNMLTTWAKQGVNCLYFAADSDEVTVVNRLTGIVTGVNIERVERQMMEDRGKREEYQVRLEEALPGVEFEYEQMDFEDVVRHVKSYEAAYGGYPDVIFIDNLIDFVDSPTDFGGMLEFIRAMDGLSKEIKAHICILHHAKLRDTKGDDAEKDPLQPPADWEVQGRITQLSRLVLTICAVGLHVNMSVVKNTLGPQTRDASRRFGFEVYSSMQVAER